MKKFQLWLNSLNQVEFFNMGTLIFGPKIPMVVKIICKISKDEALPCLEFPTVSSAKIKGPPATSKST